MTRWTVTLFLTAVLATTVVRGQTIKVKDTIIAGKSFTKYCCKDTTDTYFYDYYFKNKGQRIYLFSNGKISAKGQLKKKTIKSNSGKYLMDFYCEEGKWIYYNEDGTIKKKVKRKCDRKIRVKA